MRARARCGIAAAWWFTTVVSAAPAAAALTPRLAAVEALSGYADAPSLSWPSDGAMVAQAWRLAGAATPALAAAAIPASTDADPDAPMHAVTGALCSPGTRYAVGEGHDGAVVTPGDLLVFARPVVVRGANPHSVGMWLDATTAVVWDPSSGRARRVARPELTGDAQATSAPGAVGLAEGGVSRIAAGGSVQGCHVDAAAVPGLDTPLQASGVAIVDGRTALDTYGWGAEHPRDPDTSAGHAAAQLAIGVLRVTAWPVLEAAQGVLAEGAAGFARIAGWLEEHAGPAGWLVMLAAGGVGVVIAPLRQRVDLRGLHAVLVWGLSGVFLVASGGLVAIAAFHALTGRGPRWTSVFHVMVWNPAVFLIDTLTGIDGSGTTSVGVVVVTLGADALLLARPLLIAARAVLALSAVAGRTALVAGAWGLARSLTLTERFAPLAAGLARGIAEGAGLGLRIGVRTAAVAARVLGRVGVLGSHVPLLGPPANRALVGTAATLRLATNSAAARSLLRGALRVSSLGRRGVVGAGGLLRAAPPGVVRGGMRVVSGLRATGLPARVVSAAAYARRAGDGVGLRIGRGVEAVLDHGARLGDVVAVRPSGIAWMSRLGRVDHVAAMSDLGPDGALTLTRPLPIVLAGRVTDALTWPMWRRGSAATDVVTMVTDLAGHVARHVDGPDGQTLAHLRWVGALLDHADPIARARIVEAVLPAVADIGRVAHLHGGATTIAAIAQGRAPTVGWGAASPWGPGPPPPAVPSWMRDHVDR